MQPKTVFLKLSSGPRVLISSDLALDTPRISTGRPLTNAMGNFTCWHLFGSEVHAHLITNLIFDDCCNVWATRISFATVIQSRRLLAASDVSERHD